MYLIRDYQWSLILQSGLLYVLCLLMENPSTIDEVGKVPP